jgi:hypothetical protein
MNQIATIPTDDNFATAASASNSVITGEILKFSKGRWLVGKGDANSMPDGTELQVLDVGVTWVKFLGEGQKPEYRSGWPIVPRKELGDNDQSLWEIDDKGEPVDPWKLQSLVYLVNPSDGSEYTFATSTVFGRKAYDRLTHQVATRRRGAPGAVPIVRLGTAYEQSRQWGSVPAPLFRVVGWRGESDGSPRSAAVLDMPRAVGTRHENLDDEIPF